MKKDVKSATGVDILNADLHVESVKPVKSVESVTD
jgi:hypothetical protein